MAGIELSVGQAKRPMEVAKALLNGKFSVEGRPGLFCVSGNWLCWDQQIGQWRNLGVELMEDLVWKACDEIVVVEWRKNKAGEGEEVTEPYPVDGARVTNVVRAMESMCRLDRDTLPKWREEGMGDPLHQVTFRDVVLDVKASAEQGVMVTRKRTDSWVDGVTLPADWEGNEGGSGEYKRCLREWGQGEEEWGERLCRMMGYTLMGTRKYAKIFLLYMKSRGGKGTNVRLLKRAIGSPAYFGVRMSDLKGNFALDGVQHARAMVVAECHDMERGFGEEFSGLLKNMVGEDDVSVDVKYRRQQRGVVVRAVPILMSNQVPNMPNRGEGLSTKMVLVPFQQSFQGREDWDLEAKLGAEMGGICRMWAEAAVRLEAEKEHAKKWGRLETDEEGMRDFRVRTNRWDAFLEAMFVRDKDGFVSSEKVLEVWGQFCERERLKDQTPPSQVVSVLLQESSWGLARSRLRAGQRGIRGLGLRVVARMAEEGGDDWRIADEE